MKNTTKELAYEDLLGDGLEHVLSSGADTLVSIATGLNEINITGPKGERWDKKLLASELKRLSQSNT